MEVDKDKKKEYRKQYYNKYREKKKEYQKLYYKQNSKTVKAYQKAYRQDNPNKIKELYKNYYTENKDKYTERATKWGKTEKGKKWFAKREQIRREKARKVVFAWYGNKCICCGETIPTFLTLDHINNDGNIHRKQLRLGSGSAFYFWIIRNDFPDNFQILCRNCNWGKHANKGICPHKQKEGDVK